MRFDWDTSLWSVNSTLSTLLEDSVELTVVDEITIYNVNTNIQVLWKNETSSKINFCFRAKSPFQKALHKNRSFPVDFGFH